MCKKKERLTIITVIKFKNQRRHWNIGYVLYVNTMQKYVSTIRKEPYPTTLNEVDSKFCFNFLTVENHVYKNGRFQNDE